MAILGYQDVYEKIKLELLANSTGRRQRINLKQYQYDLNVSMIPVREAMIRLAEQDVIDLVPNAGFFTKSTSLDEANEAISLLEAFLHVALNERLLMLPDGVLKQLCNGVTMKAAEMEHTNSIAYRAILLFDAIEYIHKLSGSNASKRMFEALRFTLQMPLTVAISNSATPYGESLRALSTELRARNIDGISWKVDSIVSALRSDLVSKKPTAQGEDIDVGNPLPPSNGQQVAPKICKPRAGQYL